MDEKNFVLIMAAVLLLILFVSVAALLLRKEIHRGRTKSSRELLFMLAIWVGLMLLLLIIGKLGGSSTQDSSAASQENPKKSMEELKKDTEEFKEIIDEYKSIFSGIFD